MIIRKMKVSDLDTIVQMDERCFPLSNWTKKQFEYEFNENPYSSLWVLTDDQGTIIGYYDLWIIFERAELATIAVDLPYQHQGYGTLLMNHIEKEAADNECETISLEVRVSNTAAINLYESHDFVIINTKKGYYKATNGFEDAYFMMKGI